ncbi:MAG TPA: hypothetical protein VH681_13930, partial [Nitrospiraceae bacterium]
MNGDHDMTPLKTRLGRAVRQNGLYWRYVANARPWLEYRLSRRTSMTPIQESIVNDLRQNGIAITSGRALFGDSALVDELIREVNVLERTMKTEIEEARQRKDAGGFKTFLIQLLGPCPVLNPQSIFVRI